MTGSNSDAAHYLEVAVEAAREAGAILLKEFDRPKKISYKGEVDIVTESDKRSEALIVARLQNRFPQHAIIAEEGGGDAEKSARYRWYVDRSTAPQISPTAFPSSPSP